MKFMIICNLPLELEKDLQELYALAIKINDIFEHETPLITWIALRVAPHTHLQWAEVKQKLNEAYSLFTEKIKALGFSIFKHKINIMILYRSSFQGETAECQAC